MTDGLLVHDQSTLLTGVTVALFLLGDLALRRSARGAAIALSLFGFVLIGANLVVGRPIDVALGPLIGIEPLAVVGNVDVYVSLVTSQVVLLALISANLIGAVTNERPGPF